MQNALDVQTLHLDCGHDGNLTSECSKTLGLTNIVCAKKRGKGEATDHETVHPGPVPARRTHNSWASNFGELRRSTDGFFPQRLGQIALAVALILTVN